MENYFGHNSLSSFQSCFMFAGISGSSFTRRAAAIPEQTGTKATKATANVMSSPMNSFSSIGGIGHASIASIVRADRLLPNAHFLVFVLQLIKLPVNAAAG